eukprot:TRINITY_DN39050_c0_g1_i2.p1 TRINITY_DN39050_c0_g1~~TRINITY_DN39050_c0_g1_i2.p1  ORF type:complete len:274 (+),score=52.40 TRINITY_DN39050_c0_g1_i2:113-934(+)
MQSGCDNLVTSQCPGRWGQGWPHILDFCWKASEAYTLASPDIMVFIFREKMALANFLQKFGNADEASKVRAAAAQVKLTLNKYLWDDKAGAFMAYNTSTGRSITARTFLLGFPLFGGPELINRSQAEQSYKALASPDMLSKFGIRSTSNLDSRYSNSNYIVPYSNWRGPIWINANTFIAYGLATMGLKAEALDVAQRIVSLLASGIRRNPREAKEGKAWRECYSSDDGRDLAADGFLSWNTLAGDLLANLRAGKNPFDLSFGTDGDTSSTFTI